MVIDISKEPNKIQGKDPKEGFLIDGKLYNDKNAYFLQENNKVLIIGKKEDIVITITK